MDRPGATVVRHLDDALELEVRLRRWRAADVMSLVRITDVDRVSVGVRVHGRGRDAELAAGSHDPDRDLAAIRDQHLVEELRLHPTASSGWFGLTTSPSLT